MSAISPRTVIPFPQQKKGDSYSTGYIDGLRDGERWANTRFFWLGIGAGLLIALAVVALIILSAGGLR